MEEFTGGIFNDSMHNYGRAGSDAVQAGEGLWHAVQGLWEAGTGAAGAAGRAVWGTVELGGAALTFLPELAIDGIGMAADSAIDAAVESRIAPQCRVDTDGTPLQTDSMSQHHRAQTIRSESSSESRSDSTYTVRAGDSLWKIAADNYRQSHGGQVDNREVLATVQELKSTYGETIHPGMEIRMPRDRQDA